MNFKQLVVIRILLMITKFVSPPEWLRDIENLASHLQVYGPKALEQEQGQAQLIVDLQRRIQVLDTELNVYRASDEQASSAGGC